MNTIFVHRDGRTEQVSSIESVDDAKAQSQSPKIEAYDEYVFASVAGGRRWM